MTTSSTARQVSPTYSITLNQVSLKGLPQDHSPFMTFSSGTINTHSKSILRLSSMLVSQFRQRLENASSAWAGLILTVFFLAQCYILLEWVFYITKPSFLDLFSTLDKFEVLVATAALAAGLCLVVAVIFLGLGRLSRLYPRSQCFIGATYMLPAVILAALILLLIDNFTYTLFSFGISTSKGAVRGLYGLLFLILLVWLLWQVLGIASTIQTWLNRLKRQSWVWLIMAVWLVFGLSQAIPLGNENHRGENTTASSQTLSIRPNILWITADGLSAAHLSLYGYSRDTTPYLQALSAETLIVDNAFTNAKNTVGSLTALFTGRSPLETHVLYSPDILRGEAAYQHLPGILRANGYTSIQYGLPYYVDAYAVNLQEGFDEVNGQSLGNTSLQTGLRRVLTEGVAYFLFEAGNRIVSRITHIYYIQTMADPNETLLTDAPKLEDEARLTAFLDSLGELDQPTFIHLHLMGTHGPRFLVKEQVFSSGKDPASQDMWDVDFYDDSVLEFDTNLERIITALMKNQLLDRTLLIIGSDHAARVDQRQRLPLILRFPDKAITGRIQANIQGIDIAPTILDYLGLPQPKWMSGQSFLQVEPNRRYIFSAGAAGDQVIENTLGIWQTVPERVKPPFFQIGIVSIIDCQRWFELNLTEMRLTSGEVVEHTAPCPEESLLNAEQAYILLQKFLKDNGYAIDSLEQVPIESLVNQK